RGAALRAGVPRHEARGPRVGSPRPRLAHRVRRGREKAVARHGGEAGGEARVAMTPMRRGVLPGLSAGVIAALLPTATPVAAAGVLPVAAFLEGVETDSGLSAHRRDLRAGGFAGTPYVRDLEFRIRNEAFDLGRQRYSVQLSPKGFGEEGASRRMLGAL